MRIDNPLRTELTRIPYLSDALDFITAAISATFNVEHNDDGTHADVTADSITTDSVVVNGDVAPGSARGGNLGTSARPWDEVQATYVGVRDEDTGNLYVIISPDKTSSGTVSNYVIEATANTSGVYVGYFYVVSNAVLWCDRLTTEGDLAEFTYNSAGGLAIRHENGGPGIEFRTESSADHSAPSSNGARLFTTDNGAGKTQLCVRFASGATQVIATEP